MIVRALALGGLAVAGAARAEPAPAPASDGPDPAVAQAREANLEPNANRAGVTVAMSSGAGLVVGFGISDSVGRSGAVNLRLGHVATPNTVIVLEIDASAVLHRPAETADAVANTEVNLLFGAQYYVNPSLWLQAAAGAGTYQARQVPAPRGGLEDRSLFGPAMLAGLGVEVVRYRGAVLGLETSVSAMINRQGVLLAAAGSIGLAFD